MSKGVQVEKSLLEQIYDEMLETLGDDAAFDQSTLDALQELIRTNGLSKPAQIINIVKATGVETNENP
jgi:hypothetical protein